MIKSLSRKIQKRVFFILPTSMCAHHYLEFMLQMSGSKCRVLFSQANTSLDRLEHGFRKLVITGQQLTDMVPISRSLATFSK
jgi:hypothetical protein